MTGYTPKPGDIGLHSSKSWAGWAVRIGQALVGEWSTVTHTFLVLHNGDVIEATPKGARFVKTSKYPKAVYSTFRLPDKARELICEEAIPMEGTPYSFLDYLSVFLVHLAKLRWVPWYASWLPGFVHRRVQDSGHMICSQLCAEAYERAGASLTEGRTSPQDIIPATLARIVEDYRESFPGKS